MELLPERRKPERIHLMVMLNRIVGRAAATKGKEPQESKSRVRADNTVIFNDGAAAYRGIIPAVAGQTLYFQKPSPRNKRVRFRCF